MFKKGKYNLEDVADYICWYCENIVKKPINNYMLNYILIYACAEYKVLYDKSLIWDYTIEKWAYSFIMPEIFYSPFYKDNYAPLAPILGINFPNDHVKENAIKTEDKKFIEYVTIVLTKVPFEKIRDEMSNMDLFKQTEDAFVDKKTGRQICSEIYLDELGIEFKKNKWFEQKLKTI